MTARRTCPACSRRYAGLVDPECVICSGLGVVGLGAAALHTAPAAAVARAVELYLEAAARDAGARLPPGQPRREALEAAAAELRVVGVLADPPTAGPQHPATGSVPVREHHRRVDVIAAQLAARAGVEPTGDDAQRLDADPTLYGPRDRPGAAGLPVVSAAGHPARLAMAADPKDPLGSTRDEAWARINTEHRAAVVAAAVGRAATLRARRAEPARRQVA